MNRPLDAKIGTRVTYRDVNLLSERGTIVAIGKTPNGGDCQVRWDRYSFNSNECLRNLMPEHA